MGNTTINNDSWNLVNGGNFISLPAAAEGSGNLILRWDITTPTNKYYGIDDITVIGTPVSGISTFDWNNRPVGENPFAVSSGKDNPYIVNGIALKWTGVSSANVTKYGVHNDEYQSGTNSFTLQQQNANNSNRYTTITLELSEPVIDLSFTLFDIDRSQNQFRDKIEVQAYIYETAVNLDEKRVVVTTKNEFRANNIVSGQASATDAVASSADGNVKISYKEYVNKLVIRYYNEEPTISISNGLQGVAIHNISWRNEYIAPLPVELMYFKGAVQGKNASLTWATAQEIDNEKFVVERSLDGKSFKEIGEVKGNGNSSSRINYSFTDTNPAEGVNYYRLRQIDFSGTEETSNVVALQYKGAAQNLNGNIAKVYPTIASSEVTVSLAVSNAQITVLDANGRQVAQYSNVSQDVVVPTASLQPGMYFVKVSDGTQHQTQRFVKQ